MTFMVVFFSRERVTHVGWSCERSDVARFCTYHAWMGVVMRWSCCISNKTVQNIMHVYCKKRAFFNDFDIVPGHWITHYSRKYAFSAGMFCLFQRMCSFCWFNFYKMQQHDLHTRILMPAMNSALYCCTHCHTMYIYILYVNIYI